MDFSSFRLLAAGADLAMEPHARADADGVELRMDFAADPLDQLESYDGELPVLVTNRVAWEGGEAADTELTKYASSPKNLTELGVKFTELAEQWEDQPDTTVGVHSLSQLLMYWDADRIYQFVRVLLGRTRNQDWLTVAVINSTMHDERTLHTLLDPFDTVVDTRTTDEGWEMRLRDRSSSPTDWQEF